MILYIPQKAIKCYGSTIGIVHKNDEDDMLSLIHKQPFKKLDIIQNSGKFLLGYMYRFRPNN